MDSPLTDRFHETGTLDHVLDHKTLTEPLSNEVRIHSILGDDGC